jgi:enamine deaminase RidA (YjgF/YER057c/UK114 family)
MSPRRVENLNPSSLAPPSGYSHVTRSGGFVWIGGQIGCDASGAVERPGDLPAQFDRAIRNVAAALEAAGCAPEHVVKLTYYVTDVAAYRRSRRQIGDAYRAVFGKHYPASSLIEVKGLFDPEAMVEIECVAVDAER